MKILMIAPQPFFQPRGTPISVYQRLMALSSLGYEVDLATYHVGQEVDIPRVRLYRVPRSFFIKEVQIGPSWSKLFLDVLLFCLAFGLLLRKQYDVIHSHEEAAFFTIILAALFRTRHLYDMHSSLPQQMARSKYGRRPAVVRLFALLEKQVLKVCDSVITIDTDLEAYVRSINSQVPQIRIENLALPGETKAEDLQLVKQLKSNVNLNSKAAVVYTGTFEPYQGLDLLLASAPLVKARHPQVVFVLVGGKPAQIASWRQVAEACGIADCTVFVGTVGLDEAFDYLSIADVLVSPRAEGTSVPLKIYSYLHSGKPIVATNSVAHTQVLNNEVAILVEPTSEALAGGILMLLKDPETGRRIGAAARKFAEARYSFKDYVAKLAHIYDTVLLPAPARGVLAPAKLIED
jgi:glycosyltransferase involved in cell wall biosynthesis